MADKLFGRVLDTVCPTMWGVLRCVHMYNMWDFEHATEVALCWQLQYIDRWVYVYRSVYGCLY